jgi:hypothetical protein
MGTPPTRQSGSNGKQLTRKPAREFKVSRSKDGKYWIFRDTTTWFIPTNYLAAISKNASSTKNGSETPISNSEVETSGGENDRSH